MSQVIVHILRHSFAICGFSDEIPKHWPEGHKWVGAEEAENATCPECKAEFWKIGEKCNCVHCQQLAHRIENGEVKPPLE